jgi:hypothetical protein
MTDTTNLLRRRELFNNDADTFKCSVYDRTYYIRKCDCGILLFFLALFCSGGIMYGTKCQQEKRENAMYHYYFCNTTQYELVPPASAIITFHSSGFECQWSNISYFDCQNNDALSQRVCVVEKRNQLNNPDWPCVVRILDNKRIDCQTLPRSDIPDDNKIITCGVGIAFLICGGIYVFFSFLILWMHTFSVTRNLPTTG